MRCSAVGWGRSVERDEWKKASSCAMIGGRMDDGGGGVRKFERGDLIVCAVMRWEDFRGVSGARKTSTLSIAQLP